ncbi:MAG: methionine--tRNA ligase [Armatimonadetes bacterium]|nr:methionine--tRNA ligase [Armatimonadota bacterium]NIO75583.1 methionine--tRNA ligase [Armatimonadota bacterium]NIO98197.1 methionine--tRNA ligase [Armatimonadota bacterium]
MTQKTHVTTTIPYVNARPHVGFALELAQADAIARYHRLVGHDTRLQTGTDENALKNVVAASERGISPEELVSQNSGLFRALVEALNVSADDFVRTSEQRHTTAVEYFWLSLKQDDIYQDSYSATYCIGCEDFLLEQDLVEGRCPDHGTVPEEVHEQNYFFRLSAYQDKLDRLISTNEITVFPETRKNEILAFIRRGLHDISISRTAERAGGWGITVPGDPSQVVYVWTDALINYLTGPGLGASNDWQEWWNDDMLKIHAIGKNVWKFHAIYWPAFLLSATLSIPNQIVIHGFLTENGRKISKSLGNAIDPLGCINEYGADAVRYYLLRMLPPFIDSDFQTERLRLVYNTDLANDLGNLVSRLTTLCVRAGYRRYHGEDAPQAPAGYHEALGACLFDQALDTLWSIVAETNKDIEWAAPWNAIKSGQHKSIHSRLHAWLGELYRVGYWLAPFMPTTAKAIQAAIREYPIQSSAPLFPRKAL